MTKSSRITAALAVLVAVAMVGMAMASNMAFKINVALLQRDAAHGLVGSTGTGNCNSCFNAVSLPDTGQFNGLRLNDICVTNANFLTVAQTGFCSGSGLATILSDAGRVNALNCVRTCGGLPGIGSNPPYQTERGLGVQLRSTVLNDSAHVFVGAHAPGTQYHVRQSSLNGGSATGCAVGNCLNVVNLPYHTTAARLNDICLENSNFKTVSQTGVNVGTGTLTTVDPRPVDNLNCVRTCGGLPGIGANCPMQIGKPVVIVIKDAVAQDVLWSPAHF